MGPQGRKESDTTERLSLLPPPSLPQCNFFQRKLDKTLWKGLGIPGTKTTQRNNWSYPRSPLVGKGRELHYRLWILEAPLAAGGFAQSTSRGCITEYSRDQVKWSHSPHGPCVLGPPVEAGGFAWSTSCVGITEHSRDQVKWAHSLHFIP